MKELFNFVKDLESKSVIIVLTISLCLSIFLVWQVTNHIPTQIKGLETEIKGLETEMKGLETEIKGLRNDMNRKFDDIYKILIEIKNK